MDDGLGVDAGRVRDRVTAARTQVGASSEARRRAGVPEARGDGERDLPRPRAARRQDLGEGAARLPLGARRVPGPAVRGVHPRRVRARGAPTSAGRDARAPRVAKALLHRVRDRKRDRAGREEVHVHHGQARPLRDVPVRSRRQRARRLPRDVLHAGLQGWPRSGMRPTPGRARTGPRIGVANRKVHCSTRPSERT